MAAVTRVDCILVSPPGEFGGDKGYCTAAVEAGQPVIIAGTTPPNRLWSHSVSPASGTTANGIALKDCGAGGTVEYAFYGEMDGYSGLTPGAPLTIVGGLVDTTAPAAGVRRDIVAVTPTSIRFSFV